MVLSPHTFIPEAHLARETRIGTEKTLTARDDKAISPDFGVISFKSLPTYTENLEKERKSTAEIQWRNFLEIADSMRQRKLRCHGSGLFCSANGNHTKTDQHAALLTVSVL